MEENFFSLCKSMPSWSEIGAAITALSYGLRYRLWFSLQRGSEEFMWMWRWAALKAVTKEEAERRWEHRGRGEEGGGVGSQNRTGMERALFYWESQDTGRDCSSKQKEGYSIPAWRPAEGRFIKQDYQLHLDYLSMSGLFFHKAGSKIHDFIRILSNTLKLFSCCILHMRFTNDSFNFHLICR